MAIQNSTNTKVTSNDTSTILYGGITSDATFTINGTSSGDTSGSYVVIQPTGGNVGIGTSTPSQLLEIGNDTMAGASIVLNAAANQNKGIVLRSAGTTNWYIYTPASTTNLVFNNGTTDKITCTSTGNVGIGTTDPNYQLELSTDSAGKPGAGGLWTVVSDERIKENIELANLDRCYEIIKTIPLKRFDFKTTCYTDEQVRDRGVLGWIAQDVQLVFPKAVGMHDFTLPKPIDASDDYVPEIIEDCLDLDSGQINAALYGAVQKMIDKIELLEGKIEILENK